MRVKAKIHTNSESRVIIQPFPFSEGDEDLFICPTLSTTQTNKHMFEIEIFLNHPDKLKKWESWETFWTATPEQTNYIEH